jgi:hypothetical protein
MKHLARLGSRAPPSSSLGAERMETSLVHYVGGNNHDGRGSTGPRPSARACRRRRDPRSACQTGPLDYRGRRRLDTNTLAAESVADLGQTWWVADRPLLSQLEIRGAPHQLPCSSCCGRWSAAAARLEFRPCRRRRHNKAQINFQLRAPSPARRMNWLAKTRSGQGRAYSRGNRVGGPKGCGDAVAAPDARHRLEPSGATLASAAPYRLVNPSRPASCGARPLD